MPPLYHAASLKVSLGGAPVLKGLDLDVAAGTWTAVLGPNGAGKTTLLRTLGGLLSYGGALEFEGADLKSVPPARLARRVAFVRQTLSLAFDLTVEEVVALGRTPHGGWLSKRSASDRQAVADALARTDLQGLARRPVPALSGGEQRRVLLAQALAQATPVLLLDEPTAHLDVHHQFGLMERVRALVDEGRTAIGAFHDLALAARFADALLVLQDGRVVAHGVPEAVLTPALIRSVFRVEATVEPGPDGLLVRYLGRATPTTA